MEREEFAATSYKYRAFISYAREDRDLVDDLYKRLTKWRAPGPLRKRQGKYGAPPRALSVYMDRKSQQTGEILSSGLRDRLEQSAFLIVVCSRAGANPDSWVTREIEHFLKIASPDRIIPIIVREDADQPLSEVFPAPLLAMGEDAPIGADLLHDGGIVPVTHKIIGGLTGFSQNEIAREQEIADKRTQRNAQRVAAAISLLFVAASISAINAMRQRNQALYEQSNNLAEKARVSTAESATDFAMLLALEGAPSGRGVFFDRPDNPDIAGVLPSTIYNNRISLVLASKNGAISRTALSNDGAMVARIFANGAVDVVDVESGDTRFSLGPVLAPIIAAFSPDGSRLVRTSQRRIEIFDTQSAEKRADLSVAMQWPQAFFSSNGRYLYAADQQTGAYSGWAPESGERLTSLPAGAILAVDPLFERALVRQRNGTVLVVDLNEARSDGVLPANDDGVDNLHAIALEMQTDAPIAHHQFDAYYLAALQTKRASWQERVDEVASKVANFNASLTPPGGQRRPIQFSAPDRQYFIAGDTAIELVVPSAVAGGRRTFPTFSIIDVSEKKRLRAFNGFPVNVSQSGDLVFYIAQSDCELNVYIRSEDDSKNVREQPNGCENGYFVSQFYPSPNEQYAIAVYSDGIFLLNLHSLKNGSDYLPVHVPLSHAPNERVIAAGFDTQSKVAYTFTDDGGRLWDPETGDPLGRIKGVFHGVDADGRRIVTLGEDRAARVTDLDLLPSRLTWPGTAFVDPSGRRSLMVDTVNVDSFVPYILDIESGNRIAELAGAFDRPIAHAGVSRDGAVVATLSTDNDGNYDKYVELWDGVTGAPQGVNAAAPTRIAFPSPVASFMLAAEDNLIIAIGVNNVWYGYDLKTGRERWRNAGFVTHQLFGQTENLQLLLLGSPAGRNAIIWSPFENRVVMTLPPGVTAIASNPDNSLIAASSGNTITLYRRVGAGYQQAGVYSEHNAQISSLRINRAGDKILSAAADRTVHLWDANTGVKIKEFREPDYPVTSAIFNPGENRIISTSASGFVRVWDVASGVEIAALQVESAAATYSWAARLSADERNIIVSTIRSTRRFELPPQYESLRATIRAACDALPKGATLDTDFARERYKLRASKGVGGNPCEHYGLLHWKYYRAQWCSAVGYGCAGDGGWLRRRFTKNQ